MTEDEWLTRTDPLWLVEEGGMPPDSPRFRWLAIEWGKRLRDHLDVEDRLWFDAYLAWAEGTGGYPKPYYDTGFDYSERRDAPSQWQIDAQRFMECLKAGRLIESAAYAAESVAEKGPSFVEQINFDHDHRGRSVRKRLAEEAIREARLEKWEAECEEMSERVRAEFCAHYRDVLGSPFQLISFDPDWQTPTVLALAQGIFADRSFDRLPILADAFQDAGCESVPILNHCRGPGPHIRGCWVVDLVLSNAFFQDESDE
jgi:hypothetical protein